MAGSYDDLDQCVACGEHLSDPHAPTCPVIAEPEELNP